MLTTRSGISARCRLSRRPGIASTILALALGISLPVRAQTSDRNSSNKQSGRVNASGGDFPSWERDVSVGEGRQLPQGRPGHHEPGETLDVGDLPLGVVALVGGRFATALSGGGVIFVDVDGTDGATDGARVLARLETAPCTQPPVALESDVVATMGRSVARVAPDGILWSRELSADLAIPPVLASIHAADIVCALSDGSLTSLASGTGEIRWSAGVGSAARSIASLEGVLVAALTSGDVVGVDRVDGRELWRTSIGTSASAVIADASAAWVSGRGRSGRSKDVAPVIARLPLSRDGRSLASGRNWRLRVGGDCDAAPLLIDDVVAFTCHDGYVRAIDRVKGVDGWRTDLPARAWHSPLLAGGRLEFVLDQTRLLVVLQADNGAVLGWSELADEDEIFVGPAAWASNVTVAATSLGRLVMMRWEWDAKIVEEEGDGLGPGNMLEDR